MNRRTKKRPSTRRRATLSGPQDDILRRLVDVEELARANRRELELQFRRMADMQVDLDKLKKQ